MKYINDNRIAAIGVLIAISSFVLIKFSGEIHTAIWIFYTYSIGFWFGLGIALTANRILKEKRVNPLLFAVLSLLIYLIVLLYQTKNLEVLLNLRVITSGGIGAVLFLLLFIKAYKVKINYYYLLGMFVAGTLPCILITEGKYNLDISVLLWQVLISFLLNLFAKKVL